MRSLYYGHSDGMAELSRWAMYQTTLVCALTPGVLNVRAPEASIPVRQRLSE